MFITAPLLAVAFSLGALGAKLEARRPRTPGLELCPTAVLVNTTTIVAGQHTIQHSTFLCPDDSLSKAAPASVDGLNLSEAVSSNAGGIRRNVGECKTNVPECQCGQPSSGSCASFTTTQPSAPDCNTLLASLPIVAEQSGPTFLTANNTMDLLTYLTCAVEFSNVGTFKGAANIEFCWDELRSELGVLFDDCIVPGGSTSVLNTANNGFWTQEIFRFAP